MNKRINVTSPSMPPYEEYIEEIKDIWESRWLTNNGAKHKALEKELCKYLDAQNITLFANGHLALEIAITALNLKGEIITTPFTFASTSQAVVRCGLTPVFCDINPDTLTIDTKKIESLITEKTSAILPVHVYGNICNVYEIDKIAKKHNLKVIYDAAHAFGEKIDGQAIGTFGDISMFSFHATKVFHTVEGGCLAYKDKGLAKKLELIKQFGIENQEDVTEIGTNAKMTEMHAAMGLCNLRHIDETIAKRKLLVQRYFQRLAGNKGLRLYYNQKNVEYNYSYFPVLFKGVSRDLIAEALAEKSVFARKYFYPPANEYKAYSKMFKLNETPISKKISYNILTLPLYPDLTFEEVDFICDIILSVI